MESSPENDDNLWTRLCNAASQNDAARVGSLLGYRKIYSPSIDEPLLCSSELADRLLRRLLLVDDVGDNATRSDHTHEVNSRMAEKMSLDCGLTAVIISPSAYETPWKSACEFIKYVHRNEIGNSKGSFLRSAVADIQSFLQQVVVTWWEEERKQSAAVIHHQRRSVRPVNGEILSERNPRYYILQLVSIVMEPLLIKRDEGGHVESSTAVQTTVDPTKNEHWTVPLDLIPTIVSLSNDLETSLLHSVLDLVFHKGHVRSDRILPWVNASSELRLFLREEDCISVRASLHEALTQKVCLIHSQDLPRLSESVFSLCTAVAARSDGVVDRAPCWHELIMQLLFVAASTDLATFSSVETILESSLASLPSRVFHQWTASMSSSSVASTTADDSLPVAFKKKWVEANMLLLVLRASQLSGSQLVPRLLAQAVGGSKGAGTGTHAPGDDLNSACWKRLVSLASQNELTAKQLSKSSMRPFWKFAASVGTCNQRRSTTTSKILQRNFDGLTYIGRGHFRSQADDDHITVILTGMSSLVFYSLILDCEASLQSQHLAHAMGRAQMWVHCANESIQKSRSGSVEAVDLVVAIVILITVYCEVTMARSFLARNMLQVLSSDMGFGVDIECLITMHSLVISVLLRSSQNESFCSKDFYFELDRISEIFVQSVPLAVFCDLARALSTLPSARRALLAAAQKHLGGAFQVHFLSPMEGASRSKSNSFEKVKCGLLALVVLMSDSSGGGHESEAWFLLSGIIVENRPYLPVVARSWLFCQLKASANKKLLSGQAVKRLLRACLVRLLCFVGTDKNGHESFLYEEVFTSWGTRLTKQIEDIVGLFDLVFALLNSDLDEDIIMEERRLAFAKCLALLLSRIETEDAETSQRSPATDGSSILHPVLPLMAVNGCYLCYVAFHCLALALQDFSKGIFLFDGKILPPHSDIKMQLVEQERNELSDSSGYQSVPAWLSPKMNFVNELDSRKPSIDKKQSVRIRLSLYDSMVELLLGPTRLFSARVDDVDDGDPSNDSRMLAMQLTAVCSRKRKLADQLSVEDENNAVIPYNSEKLTKIFDSFCAVVVPVLKQYISDLEDFSQMSEMLSATIDLCETITTATETQLEYESSTVNGRLACLRDLYTAFCEEKAAVQLICYFVSRCSDDDAQKQVCRTSIDGPGGVDCAIRRVRISIVRSVSVWLAYFLQFKGTVRFEGELEEWEPASFDFSPDYDVIIGFLNCITGDLRAGLEGASGGLTYDLFLSMVDCIELCAKALFITLSSALTVERSMLASLVTVCQSTSKSLESILCDFNLEQAATFKRTWMLCVGTIPALARCVGHRMSTIDMTHAKRTCSVAAKLFDQLTLILKRKTALDGLPETASPWVLIAGQNHLGGKNGLDYNETSVHSDAVVGLVEREGRIPQDAGLGFSDNGKVLLGTERTWVWALCCVLQAFEDHWESSQRLIQCSVEEVGSRVSTYCTIRHHELTETMRSLCILFESTKKETKVDATKATGISVYAEKLPSAAKTKFCSAVDRVLLVLQNSIKRIVSHFRSQIGSQVGDSDCRSFAEAFSCLSVWLNFRTVKEDIISGVQRWYMVEKQLSVLPRRDYAAFSAEASVLRRLPRLVFRLEDLDHSLRKLMQLINECMRLPRKNKRYLLTRRIDSLVAQSATAPADGAFFKLLSDKITFLEHEQVQLECDFGMSSVEDHAIGNKRKRNIDIGKHVQSERRRRILRSRNGVVDTWLHMDRSIGLDEAICEDAYADLEDFLVDG